VTLDAHERALRIDPRTPQVRLEWPVHDRPRGPHPTRAHNQVCPLTPLVEELGAESGTVTDIFLPDWLSLRFPPIFGSLLLVGLVLNARALMGRRGLDGT
jgi:hypothetical protein